MRYEAKLFLSFNADSDANADRATTEIVDVLSKTAADVQTSAADAYVTVDDAQPQPVEEDW